MKKKGVGTRREGTMNYVAVISATRGTRTSRHESPPRRLDHKMGTSSKHARRSSNRHRPRGGARWVGTTGNF